MQPCHQTHCEAQQQKKMYYTPLSDAIDPVSELSMGQLRIPQESYIQLRVPTGKQAMFFDKLSIEIAARPINRPEGFTQNCADPPFW
jgi:hypothetical protein